MVGGRAAPRALPAADAAEFVRQKLHGRDPAYRAVVVLHAPAPSMAGTLGDPGDVVEAIDDIHCLLRTAPDTLPWLAARLLALGIDFEVREPPELAAALREMGERAGRAATGSDA